jgi:hypothetical protein
MRDQWLGAGIAFDLGIVGTDATLAGMVWRNLFASRGALPPAPEPGPTTPATKKLVIASAEDAALPPTLYQFVAHVRREVARLEAIPDKEVIYGRIGEWGAVSLDDCSGGTMFNGSLQVSSVHAPAGEPEFEAWQATGNAIKGGQRQAATA